MSKIRNISCILRRMAVDFNSTKRFWSCRLPVFCIHRNSWRHKLNAKTKNYPYVYEYMDSDLTRVNNTIIIWFFQCIDIFSFMFQDMTRMWKMWPTEQRGEQRGRGEKRELPFIYYMLGIINTSRWWLLRHRDSSSLSSL